jgi:hypothetical protein
VVISTDNANDADREAWAKVNLVKEVPRAVGVHPGERLDTSRLEHHSARARRAQTG